MGIYKAYFLSLSIASSLYHLLGAKTTETKRKPADYLTQALPLGTKTSFLSHLNAKKLFCWSQGFYKADYTLISVSHLSPGSRQLMTRVLC